jgi:hypothetical protein
MSRTCLARETAVWSRTAVARFTSPRRVADLGPALLFGVIFAWFADVVLASRAGVTARRASIVFTAAALTLLSRDTSQFVTFDLVGIAVLVLVTHRRAAHPHRSIGWTWKSAGALLGVCIALTATTVSYGRLHALAAEWQRSPNRSDWSPCRCAASATTS